MKKIISILLLVCLCLALPACGSSSKAAADKSASPAASAAAPTEAPAAPAETAAAPAEAPAPAAAPVDLQTLVDSLNEEEIAQRTEDDSYVGLFAVAKEKDTIVYKIALDLFEYVVLLAEGGDAEALNRYNLVLDSLPPLENSLTEALRTTNPGINVDVYLMNSSFSGDVVAVVHGGAITYDQVNGVGTAPTDVKPIIDPEEMSPELKAQIEALKENIDLPETTPAQ